MALHSRDTVTVSAAVATRSCTDCRSMEDCRRKSLIMFFTIPSNGHTNLSTAPVCPAENTRFETCISTLNRRWVQFLMTTPRPSLFPDYSLLFWFGAHFYLLTLRFKSCGHFYCCLLFVCRFDIHLNPDTSLCLSRYIFISRMAYNKLHVSVYFTQISIHILAVEL